MRNPRILVVGHGKSGKDLFAHYLIEEATLDLNFISSSYKVAELAFKEFSAKYNYETPLECYEDRRNHREEWKQFITDYNTPDPTKLARQIYEESDIYVGMRTKREFNACMAEDLFDLIFYVYRNVPNDPTFEIEYDESIMTSVSNAGNNKETLRETTKLILGHYPLKPLNAACLPLY